MAVILNSRQTGSVTMTKPWYFDYIDAILGDKDKITTPLARDTEREHLSNKYKSDFLTETPTEKQDHPTYLLLVFQQNSLKRPISILIQK